MSNIHKIESFVTRVTFPLKSEISQDTHYLHDCFNIVLEILVSMIGLRETRHTKTNIKLRLLAGDKIAYLENARKSIIKQYHSKRIPYDSRI